MCPRAAGDSHCASSCCSFRRHHRKDSVVSYLHASLRRSDRPALAVSIDCALVLLRFRRLQYDRRNHRRRMVRDLGLVILAPALRNNHSSRHSLAYPTPHPDLEVRNLFVQSHPSIHRSPHSRMNLLLFACCGMHPICHLPSPECLLVPARVLDIQL